MAPSPRTREGTTDVILGPKIPHEWNHGDGQPVSKLQPGSSPDIQISTDKETRLRSLITLPTSSEVRPGRPVAAVVPVPRPPTPPATPPSPEDWWDDAPFLQPPAFVINWDALPQGPPAPPPPANLPPVAYFPAGMNMGQRPCLPPPNLPPLNPPLLNPPPPRPPNYAPVMNHDLGIQEWWG